MDETHSDRNETKRRREFSRRGFLRGAGAAALAAGCGRLGLAGSRKRRPNVMIILSDDQGCVDINCYGAKDLYTPNLDALARSGLRFTEFYMGAPVCSPSRAALLTGRDCNVNGVPGNGRPLKPDEITIAEMLRGEGYRTGLVGKWHLGAEPGPLAEGFEYFFGHLNGCIENYRHHVLWWDTGERRFHDLWRNKTEIFEDDKHFGELIVREATAFLDKHKDEPFFLYVPFNNPHYPVQPLPQHTERYRHLSEPRRSYAAFVSTLDEQVGKIIKKVDDLGLREDTYIIFMSDHGHSVETRNDLLIEEPGDWPGGGSAGPYRGHKATLWEGGIRAPCIVSKPGAIPENEVRGQIATSLDWLPTIAEWTGTPLPDRDLDGKTSPRSWPRPTRRRPTRSCTAIFATTGSCARASGS